jgi:hypothetical protein
VVRPSFAWPAPPQPRYTIDPRHYSYDIWGKAPVFSMDGEEEEEGEGEGEGEEDDDAQGEEDDDAHVKEEEIGDAHEEEDVVPESGTDGKSFSVVRGDRD